MQNLSNERSQRLTDRLVKRLAVPAKGMRLDYDGECSGFAVRTTAAGAQAFVLRYRNKDGRQRCYTIGSFPDWSTSAARDEARALKVRIDQGEDPMANREAARMAPTIADLAARWIEDGKRRWRPRTVEENETLARRWIIPRLGQLRVASVTRADIQALHAEISRTAKVRANRAIAAVKAMLGKAIEWGLRPDNPAQRIERNPEHSRERYLAPDELRRLIVALDECSNHASADAIRLCLLTGARRGEVLNASWGQFEIGPDRGIWTKPASTTKQKRSHRVPLNAAARAILGRMAAKATGPQLFPGRGDNASQGDLKKTWQTACKRAGITGLRVHVAGAKVGADLLR